MIIKKRMLKSQGILYCLLAVLITVTPIIWMVFGSLKSDKEVLAVPMRLLPSKWIWSNYPDAWDAKSFSVYLKNSVIMTFFIIIGHLLLASLAGYGFAKFNFPGQRLSFLFV